MEGPKMPTERLQRLYSSHYRGAWVRAGASLFMWLFVFAAYLFQVIEVKNFLGVSASVGYLMLIGPSFLWVFRYFTSWRASNIFAIFLNLLEIIGYTGVIYFLGGIKALWLSPIYIVLINYVGLIGPRRLPFILATFCGGAVASMVILEYSGVIPNQYPIPGFDMSGKTQAATVVTLAAYLYVVAFVSAFAGGLIKKNRRLLQKKNVQLEEKSRQLIDSQEELRKTNQELEQRVKEKTAELQNKNEELKKEVEKQRNTEQALRASEHRYRFLTENMEDVVWMLDFDLRTTYVSPSIERVLGFTPEERHQQSVEETLTPDSFQRIQERLAEELQLENEGGINSDRSILIDVEYYKKDGSTVWMENSVKALRDSENVIVGMYGVSRDITERKQAEAELAENERKYRSLFENTPMGIALVDLDGNIVDFNRAMLEIHGYSNEDHNEVGHISEYYQNPEERKKVRSLLSKNGFVTREEVKLKRKDGTFYVGLLSMQPIKLGGKHLWHAIIQDITEQKKAEQRVKEIYKMQAMGMLAGGIAHEFNNSLMALEGNLELLKMDLSANSESTNYSKYLETIKLSSRRMGTLTSQLLAYARGGKYQPRNLKLDMVVLETLSIFQRELDPAIKVETSLQKDISHIRADHTQIRTLLLNILFNSREAIQDEGLIEITVENRTVDDSFAESRAGLKPGAYVCLSVEDSGKGVDEEQLTKIFEPFFSTKFQGRGMGMAAAYGIVKNHDGWISVSSELNKGTVVKVYLPCSEVEKIGVVPGGAT